jgi:hypothetical protein
MKIFPLFLAATLLSTHAYAEEDSYSIHLNPVGVINRKLTTEAFFPINENYSYGPAISLLYADYKTVENYEYVFGLRANKYFSGTFNTGAYIGAQLSYAYVNNIKRVGNKTYSRKGHDFRLTSVIGYLWRYDRFTFSIAIGGGLTSFGHPKKVTEDGEAYDDTITIPDIPLIIDGDFSIGWVF